MTASGAKAGKLWSDHLNYLNLCRIVLTVFTILTVVTAVTILTGVTTLWLHNVNAIGTAASHD